MFEKSTIQKQYSLGDRIFSEVHSDRADLENMFLSRIEMKQANLNYANLKNTDLSDADLAESSLVATEFNKAHLSGINLSKADLTEANFTESILNQANFTEACLKHACMVSAVLIEANLAGSDLSGANLLNANLSNANVKGAFYDRDTNFPADFDAKSRGMINKYSIEDFIAQFNRICGCSTKYLGNTMTAKYFNSSRPNFDWLGNFAIDKSSKITYQGNVAESLTIEQLKLFQQWIDSFVKSCSSIVKGFQKLI